MRATVQAQVEFPNVNIVVVQQDGITQYQCGILLYAPNIASPFCAFKGGDGMGILWNDGAIRLVPGSESAQMKIEQDGTVRISQDLYIGGRMLHMNDDGTVTCDPVQEP